MDFNEALAALRDDLPQLADSGISWSRTCTPRSYLPDHFNRRTTSVDQFVAMAMDAQPGLVTDPNAGIPWFLANYIDPNVIRVLLAPNAGSKILGEERRGSWVDLTIMLSVAEHTGEVSSYGDYSDSGSSGVNTDFPQRQNYLGQTFVEYGDLEVERGNLTKVNWVSEKEQAAAGRLHKMLDLMYHFGMAGLQNYGYLNDPNINASIAPGPKTAGGTAWIVSGKINATANEVFADIQALYGLLVAQSAGRIQQDDRMMLVLSPASAVALTATNSFNVNVNDLVKKNFPNIRIEQSVHYGATTAQNPLGAPAGNTAQLFAETVENQQTGFACFSEKQKSFPIIRKESSYRQKKAAGGYGAIIRLPFAVATMVGL